MEVVVVGAGPSGCSVGEKIAKKGHDVLILEEHKKIGEPVQCTGLVSHRIGKIPKNIVLNKIERAIFFSFEDFFEIKSRKDVYVIDRKAYDLFKAKNAIKAGAKIKLNTKFLKFNRQKVLTTNGIYKTNILVGADGPNSTVAKSAEIELPKNIVFAVQTRIKSFFDSRVVEIWFDKNIGVEGFAWIVPENEEVARIGLITKEKPKEKLDFFLKKRFEKFKANGFLGDVIRYGLINCSVEENVILVGDAACMVKPFSGGGIVYGQIGAEVAANACIKALENNDFSKKFFIENYDKVWKKKLKKSILFGMVFKKFFQRFFYFPLSFKLINIFEIPKLSFLLDMDFLWKD